MADKKVDPIEQVEGDMRKGYAEMQGLYHDGFEALMASNKAMMNGYQSLVGEMLAFSQAQMKDGAEVMKRIAAAGTFDAAAKVQAEYMRDVLQAYADEFKKLGSMTEALTKDVFAPIQKQSEAVAARASKAA